MQSRYLATVLALATLAALPGLAEARPDLSVVTPVNRRLSFGRVPFDVPSAPQRIVIRNDGDFARVVDLGVFGTAQIVGSGGSLATGEEQFWDVVCLPVEVVAPSGFVDIDTCGVSCEDDWRVSVDLDCVGGLLDALEASVFIGAYQHETVQQVVGFSNPGPDPVTITGFAPHDPAFSAVLASGSLPVTLAAGERLDVAVRFTASGGDVTSVLDVLAGTSIVGRSDLSGLQRSQVDPAATDLGLVPLGTVYTMPVSVRSSFPTARTITAMSSSRADCVITGLVGTVVPPGGFAHGVLTRTSATLGDRTCVLTVAFDQGQGDQGRVAAQVVPATFTITADDATPDDGRLDFGTRTVGSGAIDRTVTFTNLSSVAYPVFDCSRGGDGFALVSVCPSEWPAHGSITLTMRFTPGAVGQASGAISLGVIGLGGHTTAWLSAEVV
ncbi:MAG: choice-of-anchor D domain-containing protein, partial [Myxococcales bacterium]|nr:choice-of-anchor D domain-containing protein [Myxococcales bacterium]